jgi:hypothetical protein
MGVDGRNIILLRMLCMRIGITGGSFPSFFPSSCFPFSFFPCPFLPCAFSFHILFPLASSSPAPSLSTSSSLLHLLHPRFAFSCSRFRSSKNSTDGRYAEQPTARLRIPLKLGAGDVGIYFLQSPPDKPLGTVKCWVDDNFDGGKMLEGTADIDDVMASYVLPYN